MNATAEQITEFLAALFLPEDIAEFRIIQDDRLAVTRHWPAGEVDAAKIATLKRYNAEGANIYVGANPRPAAGMRGDECIQIARSVFVDFDNGATVEAALAKIAEYNFPSPSIIIGSGHGVHLYWLLADPLTDLSIWAGIQCDMIAAFGSDPVIKNRERIMRVPGFINQKPPVADAVLLECHADRRYELADLIDRLPIREDDPTPEQIDTLTNQYDTKSKASRNGSGSVIDQFNDKNDIKTMHLQRGCTPVPNRPGHLYRPGKSSGATSIIIRNNRSFHFSSNDSLNKGNFGGGTVDVLDPFDVFCMTEHGGDKKAAVRAAAEKLGIAHTKGKAAGNEPHAAQQDPLAIVKAGDLVARFPKLREAIIDGLLRATETMGLIAAAKAGKTYLAFSLALSIASGRAWLGRYPVKRGKILYVDLELHPETFARRLAAVASAMGLLSTDYADTFEVVHLRGRLQDIFTLGPTLFSKLAKGEYTAIFLDAMYRLYPEKFDENSNADMTRLFNAIDGYAEMTGSAFIVVHHASKGNQSGKSKVDVGSGASAQARAVDSHAILRPHDVDGVAVLDAATRSFPSPTACCIEWKYPLWTVREDLNPEDLKQPGPTRRRLVDNDAPPAEKPEPWTAERYVAAFVTQEPQAKALIVARASVAGISNRQSDQFLVLAEAQKLAFRWPKAKSTAVLIATIEMPVTYNESGDK